MNWRQFSTALPMLARQRGMPADEMAALVAACPGPQLNSELGSTTARQSSFTGRSGSLNGSRPASVASEVEGDEVDSSSGGAGATAAATSPRQVGGFTPVRRPSARELGSASTSSRAGAGARGSQSSDWR